MARVRASYWTVRCSGAAWRGRSGARECGQPGPTEPGARTGHAREGAAGWMRAPGRVAGAAERLGAPGALGALRGAAAARAAGGVRACSRDRAPSRSPSQVDFSAAGARARPGASAGQPGTPAGGARVATVSVCDNNADSAHGGSGPRGRRHAPRRSLRVFRIVSCTHSRGEVTSAAASSSRPPQRTQTPSLENYYAAAQLQRTSTSTKYSSVSL